MDLWSMHPALPAQVWVPLGLIVLPPLLLIAVVRLRSRHHSQSIATVLALRAMAMVALGGAALIGVAVAAVVETGLGDLAARHAASMKRLAGALAAMPQGGNEPRAPGLPDQDRAGDVAFVAMRSQRCQALCFVGPVRAGIDSVQARTQLLASWPTDGRHRLATLGDHPFLLLAAGSNVAGQAAQTSLVGAVDASDVMDRSERTAWLLLAVAYPLLAALGWSAWRQVSRSLAARIRDINDRLLSGNEPLARFEPDVQELQALADSVSLHIKRALEDKSSSDERYRRLVELAPDAVLMCADTKILSANPSAVALAGAQNELELVGSRIDRFLRLEDRDPDTPRGRGVRLGRWTPLDGTDLHVEVAVIADAIGGELVRQFVVRDVTHNRQREADLAHRAEHDSLTGLVNRARFEARLRELLLPGSLGRVRDSGNVAVLFIDLDDFKPVNDTQGHAVGDAVLVAVGARLQDSTRGTDLVGRLGGDEFAVLLEVRDVTEAESVADRILRTLRVPVITDAVSVSVRGSIGIATTRPNSLKSLSGEGERPMTAAELLKAADAAMYAAKSAGGDRYASDRPRPESPATSAEVRFRAMA